MKRKGLGAAVRGLAAASMFIAQPGHTAPHSRYMEQRVVETQMDGESLEVISQFESAVRRWNEMIESAKHRAHNLVEDSTRHNPTLEKKEQIRAARDNFANSFSKVSRSSKEPDQRTKQLTLLGELKSISSKLKAVDTLIYKGEKTRYLDPRNAALRSEVIKLTKEVQDVFGPDATRENAIIDAFTEWLLDNWLQDEKEEHTPRGEGPTG